MYTKNWSLIGEFSDYGFRVSLRSAGMAASCRFQIRLERLDRNLERRVGFLAPQFAAVEQHGVEPLRIVTLAERGGVRKDMAAADRLDGADFFGRGAREAGV